MGSTEILDSSQRLHEPSGHSFGSQDEAVETILRLLAVQLGMRSCLLARIRPEQDRHEVLAAYNLPGGCDIATSATFELRQTF